MRLEIFRSNRSNGELFFKLEKYGTIRYIRAVKLGESVFSEKGVELRREYLDENAWKSLKGSPVPPTQDIKLVIADMLGESRTDMRPLLLEYDCSSGNSLFVKNFPYGKPGCERLPARRIGDVISAFASKIIK